MRIPLLAAAVGLAAASPTRALTTTEARQVAAFTRISNKGPLDLEVKEGPPFAVSVTIDRNLQQHVRTEVEGDTLIIETREPIRPWGPATVTVSLPALRGLALHGSGGARVEGSSASKELSLSTAGSGDIVYSGATTALSVESSGSGGVTVSGPAGDLRVELRGSGEFSYRGEAGHVWLRTRGSGDVHLSGSAESLHAETSGSGDVDARDLPVRDAAVNTRGSGDVRLRLAGGRLDAATSGSGHVDWWGEGSLERSRSSGSGRVAHRQ